MKYSIILFLPLLILSCENKSQPNSKITSTKESTEQVEMKDSLASMQYNTQTKPHDSRVLKIDDMSVNGQKLMMSKSEFNQTYRQFDSVNVYSWECGNPFDWLDRKWMIKTHGKYDNQHGRYTNSDPKISSYYSNHAQYDSNDHLYLLNTAYSDKNTVQIVSKKIVLTKNTTSAEFERLFPKAEKEFLEDTNQMRFRLFTENEYDNSLLFYFKDDKFEFVWLWWLLC